MVITIVILIILAGVLINLTLGDNGLFTRSKIAKQKYEYGEAKEIVDIKLVDIQAECFSQGKEYNLEKISKDMTADTNITIDEKYFNPTSMKKEGVSDSHANLKGIVVSANAHPQFKFLIGEEGNNIKVIGITTEDVPDTWTRGDLPEGFKKLDDFEQELGTKPVSGATAGGQTGGNQTPTTPPVEVSEAVTATGDGSVLYLLVQKNTKTTLSVAENSNATYSIGTAVEGTTNSNKMTLAGNILIVANNADTNDVITLDIKQNEALLNKLVVYVEPTLTTVIDTRIENEEQQIKTAYAIYTSQDLVRFREIINNVDNSKNGKIMAPLDMSKVCHAEDIQKGITQVDWTPIGVFSDEQGTTAYKGIFDGNFQTIKGLYIKNNLDNQGLFGATKSALISGVVIDSTSYIEGKNGVGAIIGDARNTNIYKCGNSAEVKGNTSVGGIAGYTNDSDIWEVYNKANIYATEEEAGGIVGEAHTVNNKSNQKSNLSDSYNLGNITAGAKWVGGITGETNDGVGIYGCYNKGTITCTGDVTISDVNNAQVRWNYRKI